MTAHSTNPGVTVELVDRDASGIQPLRTDIAGFVGVAWRGPVGVAVPVESWRQFQSTFGGLHPDARLADAAKAFFDNNGRRVHIVRAAVPPSATTVDPSAAPDPGGASSYIVPATGFVAGAVANVSLTRSPVSVTVSVASVDEATSRITWATPLPPSIADIWTDRPMIVTALDGTRTTTLEGAAQARDHTSVVVSSVAGFRVGQQVTLTQTDRTRTVRRAVVDVLDSGRRLVWDNALPTDFAAAAADLALTTGATTAGAVFRNESGEPLFEISASSPGTWGNDLVVFVRASAGAITSTPDGVEQPIERTATRVVDVCGFSRGDLVRISQPGRPGAPVHAVVSTVDSPRRELVWWQSDPARRTVWDASLPASVDHRRPMVLERIDLTVGVTVGGVLRDSYGRLSLLDVHSRYAPPIVSAGAQALIEVTPLDATRVPGPGADPAAALVPALRSQILTGGGDGLAALTAVDMIGEPAGAPAGVGALEMVDEIAIVAAPDADLRPGPLPVYVPPPAAPDPCCPCTGDTTLLPPPISPGVLERAAAFSDDDTAAIQLALVAMCERTRIASPFSKHQRRTVTRQTQAGIVRSWRKRFDTAFAALYHPWLRTLDGEHRGLARVVPPCGAIAGIYARLDTSEGVHRAPANSELLQCHDTMMAINDNLHGVLNDEAINVIRTKPGRGIRPMGARTLSSDELWRFVNVRRLMCMIEKALAEQLQWAVFEPDNWFTCELLRLAVTSLLEGLWARGALKGATASEAFFVQCDDRNNTPATTANGVLVMDVGVAPTAPAEFVVLRIGRTEDEIQVLDPVLALTSGGGR